MKKLSTSLASWALAIGTLGLASGAFAAPPAASAFMAACRNEVNTYCMGKADRKPGSVVCVTSKYQTNQASYSAACRTFLTSNYGTRLGTSPTVCTDCGSLPPGAIGSPYIGGGSFIGGR